MDIEKLLNSLFDARYQDPTDTYKWHIISPHHQVAIENIVREWAISQSHDKDARIGQLEAKVLVYESIIKNSNFAPLISPDTNEDIDRR